MSLIQTASASPRSLASRSELAWHYAHAGRLADARAACQRAQSILTASGAELDGAIGAMEAGRVELIAGGPAAAERALMRANEALRGMGEAGFRSSVVGLLAEAGTKRSRPFAVDARRRNGVGRASYPAGFSESGCGVLRPVR